LPAAGIEGERPYFLFVGRLERLKGVQVLIEAFRSYADADLLIVGNGTYARELRRRAAGLNHVHFLGRVHPSELSALYTGAVSLLAPSIGYETFGIVVLEAFAQRTPAIVHDLGALPELVDDAGGAGVVYSTTAELVDAMRQLQADRSLRQELGERGYSAWRALWSEEAHMTGYFDAIAEARRRRG
jgi:glycosyltransferase involved in cell wall biosynthesis